jgi:hypothetical protein
MHACGGFYTDAIYTGVHANIDPQTNHEKTKMHQDFVNNGNKMSNVVKAKLEKAAAKKEEEKNAALTLKRKDQILCGCGSYYNKEGRRKHNHFNTAKHSKWMEKG